MKIAMSSYSGLGAWFVLRLMSEGHDVDYYLSKKEYEDVLKGLIPKPRLLSLDHRRHIEGYGYPSYKRYDLSLFDFTGKPKQAEHSRLQTATLGDGSTESLLEDNRELGIKFMEEAGIKVPPYQRFDTPTEAKAFIKKTQARYVYKPFVTDSSSSDASTTYVSKDDEDMLKSIDHLFKRSAHSPFILQEYIKGTEIGTEGWFNGEDFFLMNADLEEKKFMNDNKGPNTGCSGNLVFSISPESRVYTEGLKNAAPLLKQAGFRGVIDLNTIVTDSAIYALEWGPRFGYLCCPTFAAMYGSGFGEFMYNIAAGRTPEIKLEAQFGMSVAITIPPYPTEIRISKAKNVPIEGLNPEDCEQLCSTYMYDVMLSKDRKSLCTSGNYGYVGAPIGTGETLEIATAKCEAAVKKIQIPDMQYRTDIYKTVSKRYETLKEDGWI